MIEALTYYIENGQGELWSNENGWVQDNSYDTFSAAEQQTFNLPIGGHWVLMTWREV